MDERVFFFDVRFKIELTEKLQEDLWNDFVGFIENMKVYCGGGHDATYITGALDCEYSSLKMSEIAALVFGYFEKYQYVKSIKITYEPTSNFIE